MIISLAYAPRISWDRKEDIVLTTTQIVSELKTFFSVDLALFYPNLKIVKTLLEQLGVKCRSTLPPIVEGKFIYFIYPPNKMFLSSKLNKVLVESFKKVLNKNVHVITVTLIENAIHAEEIVEVIEISSNVYALVTKNVSVVGSPRGDEKNIYVVRTDRKYRLTLVKNDQVFIDELQE